MLEKNTVVETVKDINADLVLLSDIHASKSTDYIWLYKAIYNISRRQNVNAIVVLGDSLNDGLDLESAKKLSDVYYRFGKIAPVIMINGNHDLVTPKQTDNGERWFFIRTPEDLLILDEVFKMFDSIPNVNLLKNSEILLPEGIRMLGVHMPASYYRNEIGNRLMAYDVIENCFDKSLEKNEYNIFLSHSPLNFMDQDFRENFKVFNNVDLHLAGHMHNGLLPHYLSWLVPGSRGLIGKKDGRYCLFPRYCKGNVKITDNSCGVIASPYCTFSEEKTDMVKYNSLFPPVLQTVKIRKKVR